MLLTCHQCGIEFEKEDNRSLGTGELPFKLPLGMIRIR